MNPANTPAIIKPTVGRKVWYRPSAYDLEGANGMSVKGCEPLDATIIAVWDDRTVNVLVHDIRGNAFPRGSVTLLQPGDSDTTGGYVEWMPYQQGQAQPATTLDQALDSGKALAARLVDHMLVDIGADGCTIPVKAPGLPDYVVTVRRAPETAEFANVRAPALNSLGAESAFARHCSAVSAAAGGLPAHHPV